METFVPNHQERGGRNRAAVDYAGRPAGSFNGREACALVGISYRKLDYWRRTFPALRYDATGSGTTMFVSPDDLRVLDLINRLTASGVSLEAARRITDEHAVGESFELDLAAGVLLVVRWRTVEEIAAG